MPLPDAVQRFAALAGGRPLQVLSKGECFDLPAAPDTEPVIVPDPLHVAAGQMIKNQEAQQASTAQLIEKLERSIEINTMELLASFKALDERNASIAAAIEKNTATLHLPVRPMKDATGKIIGAQRSGKA